MRRDVRSQCLLRICWRQHCSSISAVWACPRLQWALVLHRSALSHLTTRQCDVNVINIHRRRTVIPIVVKLDELGKPAWIALMILGFLIWWPLGLATLAFIVGSGRMSSSGGMTRWYGADAMRP